MSALPKELQQLGPHEKLQLVEELWNSIAEDLVPEMSDELYEELNRRAAWSDANPGSEITLQELAARLGVRL
jgi:putative addiction module component (TIGR02574 family)